MCSGKETDRRHAAQRDALTARVQQEGRTMICDECNEREASCHVTVMVDGKQIRRHLCPECFGRLHGELGKAIPGAIGIGMSGKQVSNLLSSILSAITGVDEEHKEEEGPDKICPRCHTSLHAFQKSGHLGCPECYEAFREELQPMLLQIHGRVQHAGRQPLSSEEDQKARTIREELSRQMEEAIRTEDFETAARIRDQLRAMAGEAASCRT